MKVEFDEAQDQVIDYLQRILNTLDATFVRAREAEERIVKVEETLETIADLLLQEVCAREVAAAAEGPNTPNAQFRLYYASDSVSPESNIYEHADYEDGCADSDAGCLDACCSSCCSCLEETDDCKCGWEFLLEEQVADAATECCFPGPFSVGLSGDECDCAQCKG